MRRRLHRLEARFGVALWQMTGIWRLLARQRIEARRGSEIAANVTFHANGGEDAFLVLMFEGQDRGFAVEAGAYDGVTHSVTRTLEQLGWQGLLVEARPDSAALCRSGRPNFRTVEAALVGPGAPAQLEFVMAQASSNSERRSYLPSAEENRRKKFEREVEHQRINVKTVRLEQLLEGQAVIDAVVLDLEGAEVDALRGLGACANRVRLFLIEDPEYQPNKQLPVWMKENGFTFAGRLGLNACYIRRDDAALLARASAVLYWRG